MTSKKLPPCITTLSASKAEPSYTRAQKSETTIRAAQGVTAFMNHVACTYHGVASPVPSASLP
eukprot:CAMPEP_0195079028 /NCGR_PEP_ID=MMETSP0448-20130528/21068_1 /TAXON_ID=66468 /ORGANISM="Heterocapsa triquestra, Strain CCMP 448" /LENGTH=62 /DNA_ID=CAMNT_0040111823 /DNA_START=43 /DNA_END=231 /DNA_ORIENTATION=-